MAIDPRKNGVSPISGLRYRAGATQEEMDAHDAEWAQRISDRNRIKHGVSVAYQPEIGSFTESQHYAPGTPGYERGMSQYDDDSDVLTPVTSFDDLQQRRYEAQPWWDNVANGTAKFLGRAATSFINGIAGGIYGIGSFLGHGIAGEGWNMSHLWDNEFSNAMADVDEWFDQNFVNYQSLKQKQNSENGEWWKNINSMNLWMDDVLTNVGFTVGMMGSAMVGAGVGGAAVRGLRGATATAARSAARQGNNLLRNTYAAINHAVNNVGQPAVKYLSIASSSMGEAALEGLSTKREMVQEETQRINDTIDQHIMADPQVQQLDSAYQQQTALLDQQFGYDRSSPQYQQIKQRLDAQYQQRRGQLTAQYENRRGAALQQLEENATKAGNAVVGLNLAILIPSNLNLAGRFIDKAYRSAERSAGRAWAVRNGEINMRNALGQSNITGNAAEGYGSRSFAGNYAKRIGSTMFSEGIYEEMGQGAASTGAKKYHEYADADNYWRARLDPDSVDLVADGSHDFLSALNYGIKETYGSADGWKEGFIGGLTGALFGAGEMRDEWRDTRFAKRTAKELNNQLKNDRLPNLLQHLVAQSFHEQNKIRLAEEGNQNDWKTEDDKAMFSLISTFARAGRMDDLYAMIDQHTENMSDEQVQSIINGSVKEITPEMQRQQMREAINENIDKQIAEQLKDGADDERALRRNVDQAKLNEQQVRQQVVGVLGEKATDSRKVNDLRRLARRARNTEVKHAAQALIQAIDARKQAQQDYDLAMKSPESKSRIDELEEERARLLRNADNAAPDSYWDGPSSLVDDNGNVASVEAARESIKHNTDRIREAVQRYQDAVERINRETRGYFSKDQEDYLAYTEYLGRSHFDRGDELTQKWRGILPETFTVTIPKGAAKKLAEAFGLQESAVQVDPSDETKAIVSTKDMTDQQFARFALRGLLKHEYLTWDETDEDTINQTRQRFASAALDAVDAAMRREGKMKKFDRNAFLRDMEDVAKCYEKAQEYNKAFDEALANPENLLNAKQKAIRWLVNKWQKTKDKLAQKKQTVDELIAKGDEAIARSSAYQRSKVLAKKVAEAVEKFYNDKLADYFKDITDPELREELIEKTKDFIQGIINSNSEKEEPTILDVDAIEEAQTIMEFIKLTDIDEDGSIVSRITDAQRKQINKALNKLKKDAPNFLKGLNAAIKGVHDWMNRITTAAQNAKEAVTSSSTYETIAKYAKDLLSKVAESDTLINLLEELERILEQRLNTIKEDKSARAKTERTAFNAILKKVKARLDSLRNSRQPDTKPVDAEQHSPAPQAQPAQQEQASNEEAPSPAATQENQHLQNPSEAEEEKAMMEFINIGDEDRGRLGPVWRSNTGEFAYRSGFTYKPYHEIVNEYLAKLPETTDETSLHSIGELGTKSVAEWRRLAKRSEAIYNRLSREGAFGYIDKGNVKSGDEVGFLITKDEELGLIVYIVHNGQIVTDLNSPYYGPKTDNGDLYQIYQVFREEYENGTYDDALGGVMSKHKTHVANVFAGFPKYRNGANKGTDAEVTVASISDKPARFHIIGAVGLNSGISITGSGAKGQPCILIQRPGNNGLTRWRAVPVKTRSITGTTSAKYGNDMIARVLQQAAKNMSQEQLIAFLKHFLNCDNIYVNQREGETEAEVMVDDQLVNKPVIQLAIKLRETNEQGQNVEAAINIATDGNGISIYGDVRCNVSAKFLQDESDYKQAIRGGDNLPQSYSDFLKEICYTKLADTDTHDSFFTVNQLLSNGDGTLSEVQSPYIEQTGNVRVISPGVVMVRDSNEGTTTRVEFARNKFDIAAVKSIKISSGTGSFVDVTVTPSNYQRVLRKLATAFMQSDMHPRWGQVNYFEFNGVVYEFTPQQGNLGKIKFSENKSMQYTLHDLDAQLPSVLSAVLRHYNGSNIDAVAKEFFDSVDKAKLKVLLDEIREGKTSFDAISVEDKAAIVNSLKDRGTDAAIDKRSKLDKLITRLKSHGIEISAKTDVGQRLVDQANHRLQSGGERSVLELGREQGRRYFLSADGTIVYGFYDSASNSIYLDPDLMNMESLIHEYTHLWCNVMRRTPEGKKRWKKLVEDLRSEKKMWESVKESYGDLVKKRDEHGNLVDDDDLIAEEVFAHLSGQRGEQWIEAHLEDSGETIKKKLMKLVNSIIDFIKSLFGAGQYARTMQELVWCDMLSDNPLSNFDMIDNPKKPADEIVENKQAEAEPASAEQAEQSNTVSIEALRNGTGLSADEVKDILINDLGVSENDISDTDVKLDSNITDQALKDVGLNPRPKSIKPFIPVQSVDTSKVSSTVATNLGMGFNTDRSFTGISPKLDAFSAELTRGYFSLEDAVDAMKTVLNEEQRNKLWSAVRNTVSDVESNTDLAAHIAHQFRVYLNSGTTGNSEADAIFKELRNGIQSLVDNADAVAELEKQLMSGHRTSDQSTPSDMLYSLTHDDMFLANHAYLDMLTEQDKEFLSMAGYSEKVYKSLHDTIKERIRKCVL